ncbi:hypothetical protein ACYUJ6_05725 [Clostridium sp. JNZ X4-2]
MERVKSRYTGRFIEAVLDRLPNAEVRKENYGEYIVEAKVCLMLQAFQIKLVNMLQRLQILRNY